MKKKKRIAKKKAPASKKKITKKKAPAAKKKTKKSKAPAKKPAKVFLGELAGVVTHYFPHVEAAIVKVKVPKLRVGDFLRFKGHTTDFKLKIDSMQIDHEAIQEAKKGAEIGIQVPSRVREGDVVYRVKP